MIIMLKLTIIKRGKITNFNFNGFLWLVCVLLPYNGVVLMEMYFSIHVLLLSMRKSKGIIEKIKEKGALFVFGIIFALIAGAFLSSYSVSIETGLIGNR